MKTARFRCAFVTYVLACIVSCLSLDSLKSNQVPGCFPACKNCHYFHVGSGVYLGYHGRKYCWTNSTKVAPGWDPNKQFCYSSMQLTSYYEYYTCTDCGPGPAEAFCDPEDKEFVDFVVKRVCKSDNPYGGGDVL